MGLNKILFLDLDGTLWEDNGPGTILKIDLEENALKGSLVKLSGKFLRVAITNQTLFARQANFSILRIIKYRLKLKRLIEMNVFDAIAVCHHHPKSLNRYLRRHCNSRKPKSGLFELALTKLGSLPDYCIMVGDRITDIVAANGAGIRECYLLSNHRAFELNVSDYSYEEPCTFMVISNLDSFLLSIRLENDAE
jgi:D-glycero-D-manno-heptose 1,7-bisphosphate phosphatase